MVAAGETFAPDPATTRYVQGHFENGRGKRMFYCALFPAATATPLRGVVLFLHGIGEHSHRFTHVFEHLCANNYGVIAYDMASHGRSECDIDGLRAHSERFAHFVDDTNRFVSFAKRDVLPPLLQPHAQASATVPLVFMGISFGTLVGLHTVLSGQHAFRAIVLASPAISVEYTLVLRAMSLFSKPLSWLVPAARIVPGVNFDGLSRTKGFLADYLADPLNVTENLSVRMGEQTSAAMELLASDSRCDDAGSAFCSVPLLIVMGTADVVTSVPMARAFFARVGTKDKHFAAFDGLFHCIFHEPERERVLGTITQWLDTRVRGSGGGDAAERSTAPSKQVSAAPLRSKL